MPSTTDAKTPAEEARIALRAMANPEFLREISAQIRSRRPLVYLVTNEEKRVMEFFANYATAGGYRAFCWDCYNGMLNLSDMKPTALASDIAGDPLVPLDWIVKEATETHESEAAGPIEFKGNIYILWDFHRFLGAGNDPCTPDVERRLRSLARMNSCTTVIIVAPVFVTTPALEKDFAVLDFPFPNESEIKAVLKQTVDNAIEADPSFVNLKDEIAEMEGDIISAVNGLTLSEADSALAKSVVLHRRFDIPTIIKEKQQIIRKTGVLEYFTPDVGIEDIGGLGTLVNWLRKRRCAFEKDAKEYGLPTPKGVMLFGVPGSGKSLSAKATAKEYGMPLLRLDFGSLFQSYIGESERNARQAIKIAEAVAPCVLWCDEIEKGLSGVRSSGATDSGITARVISTFLTWMQEKKAPVFVIATANSVRDIPPEFLRAGRFDEIFFADVPNRTERGEIWRALLRRKRRDPDKFHIPSLVSDSEGYTGAEIEKAIDLALFEGYSDGKREITTEDLFAALRRMIPISKAQSEAIEVMRNWAAERCIRANSPEAAPVAPLQRKRELDL